MLSIHTSWVSILFHSIFYVINLSGYLILLKYIQTTYNYQNFWFATLLSVLLVPFYLLLFGVPKIRTRIKTYSTKTVFFPFLAGFIYTVESLLIYYSINNLTLSYYTILRSSFVLWNIPFFIFFLKKQIRRLYYIGCLFLLISYSIIMYEYLKHDINLWKSSLSVILSCLLNTLYNILIEYSVKKYSIDHLDFQIIFQFSYFVFAIIPSTIMTMDRPPPLTSHLIVVSLLISACLQFYFYNKIIILGINNQLVPSNVLLSGLDIIRRIALLLFSFIMFGDTINSAIIISILFFLGSSVCMFGEYFIPESTRKLQIKYAEMDEV
jgi:drug/metabolite transporter (DMT)-like permease